MWEDLGGHVFWDAKKGGRVYEPPHYQLCTQCHSVPGHNNNTYHGTQWAGVACNDCHVDIHGSFTSRLYLSTSLQSAGCFNAGCHQP